MSEPTRRSVVSGLVLDRPAETIQLDAQRDRLTTFTLFVLRPLWGYRFELFVIGLVIYMTVLCGSLSQELFHTPFVGFAFVGAVLVLALSTSLCRRTLMRLLHRQAVCRKFIKACRYSLVVSPNDRTPEVRSVKQTPAGDILRVATPRSMSAVELVNASETIAAALKVREVRIERDPHRADLATVSIIRRDPLAGTEPLVWPHLDGTAENALSGKPAAHLGNPSPDGNTSHSVWDPIPVGIDELGETVYLSLPERMILLGAETGGGKSVAMSQLVAIAALDPSCSLTLLDGKQVELAFWRSCATRVAGQLVSEAIDVLHGLRAEMDRRYEILLGAGKRKVEQSDGIPLEIVVCDELGFYMTMGDRNETKEFERSFRDLVARGRAAGIVVIAATQKPSHDIIPTSIRDLFAVRRALRCSTPQASDTILGQGWASAGYSANSIDVACRGVGYLLHEGGTPIRLRSFYLSDEDLVSLAARGAALRNPALESEVRPPNSSIANVA